jgi:acetolactate synthase-1/2/3 large subunit
MLGMHGTYEANNAMHDCDLMLCVGARFDDRITGRLDAFSPARRRSTSTSIRPRSTRTSAPMSPIVGDCGLGAEEMLAEGTNLGQGRTKQPDLKSVVEADRWLAGPQTRFAYPNSKTLIKPQYAIERLYELTKDRDVYITTEVGQHQMWAAQYLPLRGAEPLDDLGRPRHDGLWPAGGDRRAGSPIPKCAGHRHCGRSLGADERCRRCRRRSSIELPVKIFILNNEYGWAWCGSGSSCCMAGAIRTPIPRALPDFVKLAEAYGCQGHPLLTIPARSSTTRSSR